MKDKIIFGINLSHDAAIAAVINGEVVVAIEEERLNRIKHCNMKTEFGKFLPYLSIKYCCDYLKIKPSDVDLWVINACFKDALDVAKLHLYGIPEEKVIDIFEDGIAGHHLAHAYSTFYASPYKEAAILSLDVNGGFNAEKKENYSVYFGSDEGIKPVIKDFLTHGEMAMPEVYVAYAAILQLSPAETLQDYGHDYALSSGGKLMGYASWAHHQDSEFLTKKIKKGLFSKSEEYKVDNESIPDLLETADGHYVVKIEKFVNYMRSKNKVAQINPNPFADQIFGWDIRNHVRWKYRTDNLKELHNIEFGGEAQRMLEDSIVKMANLAYEKTNTENLCVAGGTMLNMVANTRILEKTPFKNVFVQPASNDGGNAIGCGLYGYYTHFNGKNRPYLKKEYNTYFGKKHLNEEVEKVLNFNWKFPFKYKRIDNEDDQIKQLLEYLLNNKVVACFKGRAEFGPRALGNRSFLASPVNPDMLNTMNDIKEREWYRPVAPIILEEEFKNFFDAPYEKSPYMTFMAYCKDKTKKKAPAICHIDGTARPQTVSESQNPFIYKLLKAFFKETGVPILINTSFNVKAPIIEGPEHAIDQLMRTQQRFTALLMEDFFVWTENNEDYVL